MKRTRVKICGITRIEDAQLAADLGADGLGLVFCERSPRDLEPAAAAEIRQKLPAFITVTALFVDPAPEHVEQVLNEVEPDLLQFHGSESAAFCQQFARPYIKAIAMGAGGSAATAAATHPAACGYVLDSHADGEIGGQGKAFDWSRAGGLDGRLILAGGLNPDNVGRAVEQVRPWAVDVSSGVESGPGIKSQARMRAFFAEVARVDAS